MAERRRVKLRCLSVWQPYATLLVTGLKQYETRGWNTSFRGVLVIQAGTRWDREREEDCRRIKDLDPQFAALIKQRGLTEEQQRLLFTTPMQRTLGKALGVVEIADCQQMHYGGTPLEDKIGCFGEGRYGFRCSGAQAFSSPIPLLGKQNLFKATSDIEQAVDDLYAGQLQFI